MTRFAGSQAAHEIHPMIAPRIFVQRSMLIAKPKVHPAAAHPLWGASVTCETQARPAPRNLCDQPSW